MIQKEGQIIHLISLMIRYTLNTMLEKGFGPPGRGWGMIHILSFLGLDGVRLEVNDVIGYRVGQSRLKWECQKRFKWQRATLGRQKQSRTFSYCGLRSAINLTEILYVGGLHFDIFLVPRGNL